MIYCPNCKEEIEDDSPYCDQCGEALVYCSNCGRVGMGRRCTQCGGLMVSVEEIQKLRKEQESLRTSFRTSVPQWNMGNVSARTTTDNPAVSAVPVRAGIPVLILYNPSLDIRLQGINGAIIGRKQGPYMQQFQGNMFVSSVHAQLIYRPDSGWAIIDKNSSNGTKLNQRDLQPDVPMTLKAGDIVTLANINLQVSIQ